MTSSSQALRLHKRPQRRLNWATAHRRWTQQRENVIFSDESPFPVERHDGRERVYHRRGERYCDCCVSTASKKQNIMVLGAISASRKSPLVIIQGRLTAQRYLDDVLRPVLIPFINQHQNVMTFQHDGHQTLQGSPIFSSFKTTSVSCQSRTLSQHEPYRSMSWICLEDR